MYTRTFQQFSMKNCGRSWWNTYKFHEQTSAKSFFTRRTWNKLNYTWAMCFIVSICNTGSYENCILAVRWSILAELIVGVLWFIGVESLLVIYWLSITWIYFTSFYLASQFLLSVPIFDCNQIFEGKFDPLPDFGLSWNWKCHFSSDENIIVHNRYYY